MLVFFRIVEGEVFGQDYYLVETEDGRFFVIYYDRAPKGSDQRKGEWFIEREYI